MIERDPLTERVLERHKTRQEEISRYQTSKDRRAAERAEYEQSPLYELAKSTETLARTIEYRWGNPRLPYNRMRRLIGREAIRPTLLQQTAVHHSDGLLVSQGGKLAIRFSDEPYKKEDVKGQTVESTYVYQMWPFERVKGNRDSFDHGYTLRFGIFDQRRVAGAARFEERPLYSVDSGRMGPEAIIYSFNEEGSKDYSDFGDTREETIVTVSEHISRAADLLEYTDRAKGLLTARWSYY